MKEIATSPDSMHKKQHHLALLGSEILNTRLSDFAILIMVGILVVAPMLENAGFAAFSYADESVTLIVVTCGALFSKVALGFKERAGVFCIFGVVVLGLLGNVLYGYQDSVFAIAVDAFTCLKMFAVYFAAKRLFVNRSELIGLLSVLGKCFVSLVLVGFYVHMSGILLMGGDRYWMGVPSYQFLYGHPTELAAYVVGFSAIFLIQKKNAPWVFLCAVLLVSTQRSKAIAMASVIFAFMLYNCTKRRNLRPSMVTIFFIVFAVMVLGLEQFEFYYGDDTSARTLLTQYGFEIATDLFPLGSGFATYGTYMSGIYYSSLYYEVGLSTIWGLMPGQTVFVSDCFWPAVVAQFGILGLFMITGVIALMFSSLNSSAKTRGIAFAARMCLPCYLLIASTSDASFFNFYGVFFAVLMASMTSVPREASECRAGKASCPSEHAIPLRASNNN